MRAFIGQSGASVATSMGNLGHRPFFLATLGQAVRKVYRFSNELNRPGKPVRNFARWIWNRLFLASADRVVLVGSVLAGLPIFARPKARGQAIYTSLGYGLGGTLGTLMAGYSWETLGSEWTFTFAATAALLALIVVAWKPIFLPVRPGS